MKISDSIFNFDGGLKLVAYKHFSSASKIATLPPVKLHIIPLQQHIGKISQAIVKVGEPVLKGQKIAKSSDFVSASIHSPVSGIVRDIKAHRVPHLSGLSDRCIFIENNFKEKWIETKPLADAYNQQNSQTLCQLIREAGIVGLGGAAFPTSVKQTEINIKTLLLNGVECEPYITCDDVLMRERAQQIIAGADIIGHIIKAQECIIAIEDNKPDAIQAMQCAIDNDGTGFFQLKVIPSIYPSGSEKQLIKIITNKEVPPGRYPTDIDVLCHNVATAYAIYQAIYLARPLISRVLTVTGSGVKKPQNIEAPIGVTMQQCIEFCDGYNDEHGELIMGGPMMGVSVSTDEMPIIKATNCLLVNAKVEMPQTQMPCIRCGKCVEVCPIKLLPQQLYWYASAKNTQRLLQHSLFSCIECGCCAYVCPSNIPLVQYYRYAKTHYLQQERERKFSDIAREHHETHQTRIDKQKSEREARLRKKRELLKNKTNDKAGSEKNNTKAVIAQALARAQAKKANKVTDKSNTKTDDH